MKQVLNKLYLYAFFHANLAFSSIPYSEYSKVLDNCYWPMLDLIDKGYKVGLEFSSSTLKEIDKIDSGFIKKLVCLWNDDKCDVIGSSYIQNIFPLIPWEVNQKNIEYGLNDYKELLGRVPEIAFVNEQTYSSGIPYAFSQAGYKVIVMDWDNANEYNKFPLNYKYFPVSACGVSGSEINTIWNSSLNSYKFQRCIRGRLSIDQYAGSIISNQSETEDRALPIYGTDLEIFNYRPNTSEIVSGEIKKIERVFNILNSFGNVYLIRPKEVLDKFSAENRVRIEAPESPLPCKNRDDYNVVRWAVSGRDDVALNTECHKIYRKLKQVKFISSDIKEERLWRTLNYLWGSDFRTRTTNEKYFVSKRDIDKTLYDIDILLQRLYSKVNLEGDFALVNYNSFDWKNYPQEIELNFDQGRFYHNIDIQINGSNVSCQCEEKEFYRDGSIRNAKLVIEPEISSGEIVHAYVIQNKEVQDNKFDFIKGENNNKIIDTDKIYLEVSPDTGSDIVKLIFKEISDKSMLGYLPPVYYDHIGHSSDYFSGWMHMSRIFGENLFDTRKTELYFKKTDSNYNVRIPFYCKIHLPCGVLWKKYFVYLNHNMACLKYHFCLQDTSPIFFRVGITTFNPKAFNKDSLRILTVNGSEYIEEFFLKNRTVKHQRTVGSLASAASCFGSTEGWIDINDGNKGVMVLTDKSELYSVPMLEYEEINDTYLLRLFHSISESDETGKITWRGHDKISFSYIGHNGDIDKARQYSSALNNKLGVIKKTKSGVEFGIS